MFIHHRTTPKEVPIPRNLERGAVAELVAGRGAMVRWSGLGTSHILLPSSQAPTCNSATRDDLRHAWIAAEDRRNEWLLNLHKAPAALPQTPKDLSVRPRYFYMRCNDGGFNSKGGVSVPAYIGRKAATFS